MSRKPAILPLDTEGKLYALYDEKGKTIGAGTREVCEVLLYIINKAPTPSVSGRIKVRGSIRPKTNVRAAIEI